MSSELNSSERVWSRLRHVRGPFVLAAVMVAFGVGAAVASFSESEQSEGPTWDQEMPWQSVASGTDSNFGRFEIYRGHKQGQDCIGIRLPDKESAAVAQAIFASCTVDPTFDAAFVRSGRAVLAYGVAGERTRSVSLDPGGSASRQGSLLRGRDRAMYFVASAPETSRRAEVVGRDENGAIVGRERGPE